MKITANTSIIYLEIKLKSFSGKGFYNRQLWKFVKLFMNSSHKFTLFPSSMSSKTQICTHNFT